MINQVSVGSRSFDFIQPDTGGKELFMRSSGREGHLVDSNNRSKAIPDNDQTQIVLPDFTKSNECLEQKDIKTMSENSDQKNLFILKV